LRKPPVDPNPRDAAWLLGLLSLHGLAMPADPAQAQHWFERAQLLGHPLAPAGMAWCQISGCVTSPNPATAMHWIALLRRTEPVLAKYLEWHAAKALAPLAEPGAPGPALREPGAAARRLPPPSPPGGLARLLAEAGRAGSSQAQNELGLEYLASGNLEQALVQFQAAAARSEAAAANASLLASRMDRNTKARSHMPRHSAGDGYQEARRYHLGDGVPANYTEAIRLYQIAAARGDPRSRRMLELIFSRPAPGGAIDIAWMQQLASIGMATEVHQGNITPMGPSGWRRDPSPLYALVPDEWHTPYRTTVR
jgi:TPR repeat protein